MTVEVEIGSDGTGLYPLAGAEPRAIHDLHASDGNVALVNTAKLVSNAFQSPVSVLVAVSGAAPNSQVTVTYRTPAE